MSQIYNLCKSPKVCHNNVQMRKLKQNQSGFIPMLICLLLIIVAVLYFSYHFVARAQH